MPERSVGGLIPARKAKHLPSEGFFFEEPKRLIEKMSALAMMTALPFRCRFAYANSCE
jgi:hypothetical protein